MGNTFLYQINVTRDCNLRCDHCYIHSDKKASSKFMSEDQFISIFEKIRDHLLSDQCGDNKYSRADIHVIGGEPCMLGIDFYRRTMPVVKSILSKIPKEVSLSIVTNLLAPDTMEIVDLFDKCATSFEYDSRFPKEKLLRMWEARARQLAKSRGNEFSITTAITNPVISRGCDELLRYFVDDIGVKNIHLGFFIPSGDGLVNQLMMFPRFEETSEYLISVANWYVERKKSDKDLYINPVHSLIDSIYNDTSFDDIVCPIIPGSLDFDWNGNTVTCIEAGGEVDADWIGNVFELSITDILSSHKYLAERIKASSPKRVCASCDEYAVCRSACGVLHGFWDGAGECPGFKKFIKHVRGLCESGAVGDMREG